MPELAASEHDKAVNDAGLGTLVHVAVPAALELVDDEIKMEFRGSRNLKKKGRSDSYNSQDTARGLQMRVTCERNITENMHARKFHRRQGR